MASIFKCFTTKTKPKDMNPHLRPETMINEDQSELSASQASNMNNFHRQSKNSNGPADEDENSRDGRPGYPPMKQLIKKQKTNKIQSESSVVTGGLSDMTLKGSRIEDIES